MTVSTQANKAQFNGAGSAGPFTFNFRFFNNSEIFLVKTSITGVDSSLTETVDYALTGAGSYSGGSITLTSSLAIGEKLTVYRVLPLTQTTDLRNQGAFFAEVHEDVFDRLTMIVQQQDESIDRALQLSVATPDGVDVTLPTPEANNIIGWDNTGSALKNFNANEFATVVSYGTAKADIFTGDGTTTDFTLSFDPANINNLDVSVGGVSQLPGTDYTWTSGTTLTMTTAVPNDVKLLVRYMRALPQGTVDWGSISSRPFIDYAVNINSDMLASSLYNEINMIHGGSFTVASGITFTIDVPFSGGLERWFQGDGTVVFGAGSVTAVHPEWWGAVADGVVDCTTAFSKALSAGNKGLILSSGTYKANFSIPQTGSIVGAGVNQTTIIPALSNTPILTVASTSPYGDNLSIVLKDFTIDGQVSEGTDTTASDNQHGILVDGGNGTASSTSINMILMQHIKVWRCSGHGVFFNGITQASIEYDQVAWWKIDNCVIQWNRGNGVRCEGFVYQGHITGASLIEKNARGITAVVATNAANPKAQVFITKDSDDANNGYPNKIVIDGATTIQSTYAYYTTSNQYTDLSTANVCGVSIFAARGITIGDCYLEGNSYHVYVRGNGVPKNISVEKNYLHQAAVAAIDSYDHGQNLTISKNQLLNEGDFASNGIGVNCLGSTVLNCEYLNLEYNVYTGFATRRVLPTFGTARYVQYFLDHDGGEVAGTLTYASGLNFTFSRATVQSVTLTGNVTSSTFSQARTNNEYTVFISQDATGGRTFVWPATGIKWSTGSAPTVTSTASKKDMFKFFYDGTNYVEIQRLQNMPV